MVVPMEQWASQTFQDKSTDLWVVMHSDLSEMYSDMMERFYEAYAVTFEPRFPFPLTLVQMPLPQLKLTFLIYSSFLNTAIANIVEIFLTNWKTQTLVVNTMDADDLVMQGAKKWAVMVLT